MVRQPAIERRITMKNKIDKIKRVVTVFTLALMLVQAPTGVLAETQSKFDTSKVNQGILKINYEAEETLVAIVTNGDSKEQYILGKENKSIPLQLGSGKYNVKLAKNIDGNKFKVVESIDIKADIDPKQVYLNSISEINFNNDMKAIKKAAELVKNLKTDEEKIEAIYTYVAKNIEYDYDKAKTVKKIYLPTIDSTLTSQKGICYDYASMTAAMLRSQGIQTKLVKGNKNDMGDVYHAWNEVLVGDQWKIIDTTYDNSYYKAGQPVNMYKEHGEYKATGKY